MHATSRHAIAGFCLLCALSAGCTAADRTAGDGAAADGAAAGGWSEDLANRHANPESAIASANVGELAEAWSFEAGAPVSHAPLVDGEDVFIADWGGTVYRLRAADGTAVWRRELLEPRTSWPWHGFCGTGALDADTLYEASAEGECLAIDRETGTVRWRTRIAEDEQAGSIGKLLLLGGRLHIGLSSVEEPMTAKKPDFEPDFQGQIVALDAADGSEVWRTRLVEPPGNGCAVWSWLAADPQLGLLYATTGNNYTGEATPLSDAIVALDLETGELRWKVQTYEQDVWTKRRQLGPDYDFSGGPQLFTARIEGRERRLVGAGQKSGLYWVFDRETGERIWATSIGYGGIDGGMHGEAAIGDGTIYAWSNNGYVHTEPPQEEPLSVKAVDAATGAVRWARNRAQPAAVFSGAYLAGDVVFVGSLDGSVHAYRAADGETVWRGRALGPVTASPLATDRMLFVCSGVPKLFKWPVDGASGIRAFALGAAADR